MLDKIIVHKVISKYNYKIHRVVQDKYEILNQHKSLGNNLSMNFQIDEKKILFLLILLICYFYKPYFSVFRDALLPIMDHSFDLTYECRSNRFKSR